MSEQLILGDPQHLDSRRRRSSRGESRADICARSCCRRSRGSSSSTSTRRGASCRRRCAIRLLYGEKRGEGREEDRTRVGGLLANSSVATTRPIRTCVRMELEEFMVAVPCTACGGHRLKPESLAVTVADRSIGDVVELAVTEALAFFETRPGRDDGKPGLDRRDRRTDSQGSARAPALSRRRRARLSHARPRGRVAVGRRGAAHSAGDADRLAPGRRALHPRRAVHRAAPARQRAAARDARAAARPRQHRDRRRARRRDDARRRSRHRHRPGRRQARRRGHRRRAPSTRSSRNPARSPASS